MRDSDILYNFYKFDICLKDIAMQIKDMQDRIAAIEKSLEAHING